MIAKEQEKEMTDEKESILNRIQKLLRMSIENGASENEAMQAADKAQKLKIHTIFHFGEFSRINQSFYKTEDCLDFNIKGTLEVIKYCSKNNVKLVYSASSSTFNNKENLSPYAYSKFHNVNLIKNYHQWFNLKYEIEYLMKNPGEPEYQKYLKIRKKNLHKMKSIPVCKFDGKTNLAND
jgi:nucleoside-diphosphate-sugar epimerase